MNALVSAITAMRRKPRVLRGLFILLLGLILVYDFMAVRHGEHFAGDRVRTFWALFGFFGTIFMTKFMKGIGHMFLMKPMDFYTRKEEEE